eukprot:8295298-Pyramimonas_sp.AAC.1
MTYGRRRSYCRHPGPETSCESPGAAGDRRGWRGCAWLCSGRAPSWRTLLLGPPGPVGPGQNPVVVDLGGECVCGG